MPSVVKICLCRFNVPIKLAIDRQLWSLEGQVQEKTSMTVDFSQRLSFRPPTIKVLLMSGQNEIESLDLPERETQID